jgi:hypothetical protein
MQDQKDKFLGHSFHIPVMGTGFTIDTPIKIAKYGISSVISLVDDVLIEQIRKYYSELEGIEYTEIPSKDPDARAKRITEYLNLVARLVSKQFEELKSSAFEAGSEITRYFELLPDDSVLKQIYKKMTSVQDQELKESLQENLRQSIQVGSIDVNIMTKLNRDRYQGQEKLPDEYSDALAALRGYAESNLEDSSVIFSAGMNPKLYSYVERFKDFYYEEGAASPKKKLIIKVSDYRSALIQGKVFAKKGIWVSEFRLESGLNCGGHAFATKGYLMGPILEEFKTKRSELQEEIEKLYLKAAKDKGLSHPERMPRIRVTAQGGIGTGKEHKFLLNYYDLDSIGWGSPFLLVPEATSVDDEHLEKLAQAKEEDIYLSPNSPLGVPFWNLRNSSSEEERISRIESGKPGSTCPKQSLVSNTEFSNRPVCTASKFYQSRKIEELENSELSEKLKGSLIETLLQKSCICHNLSGGALIKYNIDKAIKTFICTGPNLAYFSKQMSLEEMLSNIYDRMNLTDENRPHVFIKELMIYVKYLQDELHKVYLGMIDTEPKYFVEFSLNLSEGVEYYRNLTEKMLGENITKFLEDLEKLSSEIKAIRFELGDFDLADLATVQSPETRKFLGL